MHTHVLKVDKSWEGGIRSARFLYDGLKFTDLDVDSSCNAYIGKVNDVIITIPRKQKGGDDDEVDDSVWKAQDSIRKRHGSQSISLLLTSAAN